MSITHVNNAQVILGELVAILDVVEESANGRAFHPTNIATCRVMTGVKLEELMIKARKELKLPPRKSLQEINADWSGESDVPATVSREFSLGAKAMFDALLMRTANNYHGRPAANEMCQRENKLIEEWALDALKEVSPEDAVDWVSIDEALDCGRKLGKLEAKEEFAKEMQNMNLTSTFSVWHNVKNWFARRSNTDT